MVEVTFDAEARSLYCYFTEIAEGDDDREAECPGVLLLDGEGAVLGLRVDLRDDIDQQALRFALDHPGVSYDEANGALRISFSDAAVAEERPFDYDAILDFDKRGRVLGLEVLTDPELGIENRLALLEPYLVSLDDEEELEEDEPEAAPATRQEPDDSQVEQRAEQAEAPADEQPAEAPAEGQAEPEEAARVLLAPEAAVVEEQPLRSGFVALVGKPNVGKSTLLNAYLGQKISIVSPKPQTTRVPVRGIVNRSDSQVIFIDTPGIHEPRHKLGAFMVDVARRSIPNADVILFVVDVGEPPSRLDTAIAELVKGSRKPSILVLNKVDATTHADVNLQRYRDLGPWQDEIAISAQKGEGLEALLELIVERLPAGPRYYPEDQVSDQSQRELVGELIREKVLLNTQQEVPHSVAVEVEEWEDREKITYIRATISVEKRSQKQIIIGSQGTMLKKIGAAARFEIERALGRPVYLDLWIKIREGWRQNPGDLRWLGYDVRNYND